MVLSIFLLLLLFNKLSQPSHSLAISSHYQNLLPYKPSSLQQKHQRQDQHVTFSNNDHQAKTTTTTTTTAISASPKPIDASYWPERFPAKDHCSRCGLCETTLVSHVKDSCAFLGGGMARNIDGLEPLIHDDGRGRDLDDIIWSENHDEVHRDEARFGIQTRPMQLAKGSGIRDAQWTGCVTGIALSVLEYGLVDAVVCIASGGDGDDGWSEPEPILARTKEDVLRGRGVKPALAPSLRVLDEVKDDDSIRKLLFCGVGCAVQAFRAIQDELNLDEVFVLGTNCADNSPTPQAARNFIKDGIGVDASKVRGYEFMQDFRVHVKMNNNNNKDNQKTKYIKKPYFTLPGKIAKEAIATSCLACFDYTNALADIVIGYMGAPLDSQNNKSNTMDTSSQTITIRNKRGETMLNAALDAGRIQILGSADADTDANAGGGTAFEKMALATVSSDSIIQALSGEEAKVKEKGMPIWLGEMMAMFLGRIGPKRLDFARYSIDYHVLRNYLHVLHEWGEVRAEEMLPEYAKLIVKRYLEDDDSFGVLREKVLSSSAVSRR